MATPALSATAQEVASAILSMNSNFSQDTHTQLMNFQKTREAWTIALELLGGHTDAQVQYFCASTLDAKIRTEWTTLDEGAHQQLRSTLLQHLQAPLVESKPHYVTNRLCSALANLAVHSLPNSWPTMFDDLLNTIHTNKDVVMIELLELLPSQLYDSVISREHFQAVEVIFSRNVEKILDLVTEMLTFASSVGGDTSVLVERSLKCFTGWLQFGVKLSELFRRPLLPMIFQIFHANTSSNVANAAVTCITEALAVPLRKTYSDYVHQIFQSVAALAPVLREAITNENDDLVTNLAILITGLCEGQAHILADNSPESLALVDLLLALMSTGDWEMSSRTLESWFRLQDHLTRITAPVKVSFVSASQVLRDNEQQNSKMNNYVPRFSQMLQLLLPLVQYPADDELSSWDHDDHAELRQRRDTAAEVFVSVSLIMRADILTFAAGLLTPVLQAFETNSPNASWQVVEVILHMTQAVVGWHYTTDENLPLIFETFPRLPQHERVVQATLTLIGVSASWLRGNTDLLPPSMDYVMNALQRDFAQPAASSQSALPSGAPQAFLDVASICGGLLAPKLQGIIDMLNGPVMTNIDPQGKCTIIRGLTHIISYLPLDEIGSALNWLVTPIAGTLKEFSELPKGPLEPTVLEPMLAQVTMMSCTVPFIVPPVTSEKALAVSNAYPIELAWGPLMTILQKWVAIPAVVESICEFCTMSFEFLHLMKERVIWPHFLDSAVQALLASHTPTIIATVSQTFSMLWNKYKRQPEENREVAQEILVPFNKAFEIIAADTVKILREQQGQNVELTAVLYNLVVLMLDGSPEVLVQSAALPSILEGAVVYLNLPSHESRASKVVIGSLRQMSRCARSPFGVPLKNLFGQYGKEIISAIIQCMITSPERDYQELVSVLFEVWKATREQFKPWLFELLSAPDWPNRNVTNEHKERLMTSITETDFTTFHGEVTDFILACRRGVTS